MQLLQVSQMHFAWCALILSVFCMSAGGVIFALMTSVPPFLKAAWRLWATSLIQFVPFAFSLYMFISSSSKVQIPGFSSTLQAWLHHLPLLTVTGMVLAVHFMAWAWSISHTSLAHSLLLVSSHPVMLVIGAWLLYLVQKLIPIHSTIFIAKRPGWTETAGALVAVAGAGIMVVQPTHQHSTDDDNSRQPTALGDTAACVGAAAMAFYLLVGRKVRSWMPIWVYAFPVTFVAAVTAMIFSYLLEGTMPVGNDKAAWFGWFYSAKLGLLSLAAGGISGIMGHTLANYSLKHIRSLIVSIAILGEALLGSVMGWIAGVQDNPGLFTWIGGAVLLIGAVVVTYGQNEQGSDKINNNSTLNICEIGETQPSSVDQMNQLTNSANTDL